MSPIGRVFIVVNLLLAGGFAMFAGTHLQKQHNYKHLLEQEQDARKKESETYAAERIRLEQERNTFENAKTANETELGATRVALQQANDEVKRQQAQIASLDADVKKLSSLAEVNNTEMKAAFAQAKSAYEMAVADQKVKDDAVRAKDAAEAENRTLKTTIASLEDTVKNKDLAIGDLTKEKSRLDLLVSVAQQKGFVPSMAAPTLAGMVTNASARLCTIQVTDNPGKIDIAEEIARNPFRFAVYDASGYKGEAVATKYEPSANAVLCNLMLVKGEIKEGDKASTKTP